MAGMRHVRDKARTLNMVDEAPDHARPSSKAAMGVSNLKSLRNYALQPQPGFAARLLRDVRAYKTIVAAEEGNSDPVVLATKLAAIGYHVRVRTALGGGEAACFRQLRHAFLCVTGAGDFEGVDFIVELNFRDQFSISHPTPEYEELLAALPAEFVGTTSRLQPVVQIMCAEMAASFAARGLTLPPWRRTDSMMSKWLPAKARDVQYATAGRSSSSGGSGSGTLTRASSASSHHGDAASSSSAAGNSVRGLLAPCAPVAELSFQKCDAVANGSGADDGRALRRSATAGIPPRQSLLSCKLTSSSCVSAAQAVQAMPPLHQGEPPVWRVKIGFKPQQLATTSEQQQQQQQQAEQ